MPYVAPFTGAWIEMTNVIVPVVSVITSHPSRVRGLKSRKKPVIFSHQQSRTLHGCVD